MGWVEWLGGAACATVRRMHELDRELERAFSPEGFRDLGHTLVDRLADYLELAARRGQPVLPSARPEELARGLESDFVEPNEAVWSDRVPRWLDGAIHLHHPRYVGHQVTSPLPEAALSELMAALTNNGAAVYEMGPLEVAMERALISRMSRWIGFGEGADGVFTSGGSLGNLTALLAARQAKAGFDAWSDGLSGGPSLGVLVSEQAHYSAQRALQIAGLGKASVETVPVDPSFRMRPELLAEAQRNLEARGRRAIAVIASAGSTATGAYDPLEPIAAYCEREGLWLHVDGAHGASALLSERLRPRLAGVERADSVVWDAHKMLLMPALVTAVVFRNGDRSYEAFAQSASYLFEGDDPRSEWFNLATRTLECTKRWMVLPLYTALCRYGAGFFGRYVEAQVDLAARFAEAIQTSGDFELLVKPESNIVCFRYVGAGERNTAELNALQRRIRNEVLRSGRYYLVQTTLRGAVYLRTTIINPLTSDADLSELLQTLRDAV
ncbi:MAG TPA: aminotransferase class V-fold PLP-dependent enzyme [Polyangiaceae bacterium]|nr:aminotransferase class V-fold PLP-dependent enzyme [Polyangiaceae bacterium]